MLVPGSLFNRFLNGAEWLGNALPHSVTMFALLALFIVLRSGVLAWFGVSVEDPRPAGTPGRAEDGITEIVSLVNGEGLRRMLANLVANFLPLGTVLVAVLGSASAQWLVMAPIFVPMLMLTGYSPEVIQAAYRIGDSTTDIITPMMSYFGLILAFATRYVRDLGIGTLIATTLPYSIALATGWTLWFYSFVFALGLPVGPGAPTY